MEAEASTGVERAGWLALGAALSRHRLGAPARAAELVEAARLADPDDPALLFAAVSGALVAGAVDEGAARRSIARPISRAIATGRRR